MLDFTPEWDYMAGGSKLLLTGSVLPGARTEAHTRPLFIKFDQTEVRAASYEAHDNCSLVVNACDLTLLRALLGLGYATLRLT